MLLVKRLRLCWTHILVLCLCMNGYFCRPLSSENPLEVKLPFSDLIGLPKFNFGRIKDSKNSSGTRLNLPFSDVGLPILGKSLDISNLVKEAAKGVASNAASRIFDRPLVQLIGPRKGKKISFDYGN